MKKAVHTVSSEDGRGCISRKLYGWLAAPLTVTMTGTTVFLGIRVSSGNGMPLGSGYGLQSAA
jgi:hypothetical protein